MIKIPSNIIFETNDPLDLLKWTYPDLETLDFSTKYNDACLYTPLNKDVDNLNNIAINLKKGEVINKLSSDTPTVENCYVGTEFMNNLCPGGVPPHIH